MGINDKLPEMLVESLTNDATKNAKEGDKERWLAELEDKSFKISDDRLTASTDDSDPSEAAASDETEVAGNVVSASQEAMVSVDEQALISSLQGQWRGDSQSPSQALQALQVQQAKAYGADQSLLRGSAVFRGAPTVETLQAAQRFDALMNKMRFSDLNIRITQHGDELTLWVRDFTQKYSVEVFNWVKDLQSLLNSAGKSFAKIMVNGKQIHHQNELLGGQSWQ